MQEKQEIIRGHRSKSNLIEWSDCKLTKEEIDEVIALFITNKAKIPNQEIYLSSKEN